jgi:hypothetical protein
VDDREKAQLLIRLARKNPEYSEALLVWADELLGATSGDPSVVKSPAGEAAFFPMGIFRVYKGRRYDALLLENWHVEWDGHEYKKPSPAATAVSGHQENGWQVWMYTDPATGRDTPIDKLRRPPAAT